VPPSKDGVDRSPWPGKSAKVILGGAGSLLVELVVELVEEWEVLVVVPEVEVVVVVVVVVVL
jgi:hypothetical protein